MAEWELLWENASPTSDFAAQTIQVDATSYDFYMIILKRAKDDSRNRIVEQIMPQGYGSLMVNLDSSAFAYRTVTVSTNPVGFSFEAGSKPQSYGSSSATTHNELMIPLQIWGIKGVTS